MDEGAAVVIRAHGVTPEVMARAEERGLEVIDGTCTWVTQEQRELARLVEEGYTIVLLGTPNHPEVVGLLGFAPDAIVVDEEEDWERIPRRKRMALLTQSTQPPWKFEKLAAFLVSRAHELKIVNTVCPVTIRRQQDTMELARAGGHDGRRGRTQQRQHQGADAARAASSASRSSRSRRPATSMDASALRGRPGGRRHRRHVARPIEDLEPSPSASTSWPARRTRRRMPASWPTQARHPVAEPAYRSTSLERAPEPSPPAARDLRVSTRRRPRPPAPDVAPLEGLPVVAIVGRPNVGKSTLFNRIVGERAAIVEDRARTTRDRLYGATEWNDRRFVVVDTGGLERRPGDPIEEKVQEQARLAIEEADVIVFVVDAVAGLTPADQEADETAAHGGRHRCSWPSTRPTTRSASSRAPSSSASAGTRRTPSAPLHGRGTGDLLDAHRVGAARGVGATEVERKRREAERRPSSRTFGEEGAGAGSSVSPGPEGPGRTTSATADLGRQVEADQSRERQPARIAIVGRPNVGKTSLLNALLGEERAIVSDIPGTTRDAIDTSLDWQGRAVRLVDTAGMRRRGKVAAGPAAERYSALRALKAIGRADVGVLVIDAQDGLTAQDAHVAGYVVEEGVGLVVAVNKWDLVEKDEQDLRRVRRAASAPRRPSSHFAPVVSISALTGQRVGRVLDEALEIAAERRRRIPTGAAQPGHRRGRLPPAAAAGEGAPADASSTPPRRPSSRPRSCSSPATRANVHFSYQRYLENRIRDAFGFDGTPMRLVFRERARVELEPRPSRRRRSRSGSGGKAGERATRHEGRRRAGAPSAQHAGPHDAKSSARLLMSRRPRARSSAPAPGGPRSRCTCRARGPSRCSRGTRSRRRAARADGENARHLPGVRLPVEIEIAADPAALAAATELVVVAVPSAGLRSASARIGAHVHPRRRPALGRQGARARLAPAHEPGARRGGSRPRAAVSRPCPAPTLRSRSPAACRPARSWRPTTRRSPQRAARAASAVAHVPAVHATATSSGVELCRRAQEHRGHRGRRGGSARVRRQRQGRPSSRAAWPR